MNILARFSLVVTFLFCSQAFGYDNYLQKTISPNGDFVKVEVCQVDECEVLGPVDWNSLKALKSHSRTQIFEGWVRIIIGGVSVGAGGLSVYSVLGARLLALGLVVMADGSEQKNDGSKVSQFFKESDESFSDAEIKRFSDLLFETHQIYWSMSDEAAKHAQGLLR